MENAQKEFRWLRCPSCQTQTEIGVAADTILINFPLYCPHCKEVNSITVVQFEMLFSRVYLKTGNMTNSEGFFA